MALKITGCLKTAHALCKGGMCKSRLLPAIDIPMQHVSVQSVRSNSSLRSSQAFLLFLRYRISELPVQTMYLH